MATDTYTLTADASELTACLDELSTLAESLDGRLEFVDRLLCLLDSPSELVRVEPGVTVGATHVIALKPSDLLLELLATARTGNG